MSIIKDLWYKPPRDSVLLDADALDVDVTEFERLIDDGAPTALERAAELHRGDLLDGIGVHDPAFEDWLRDERQRLNERACEGLSKLLDHQAVGDSEPAIATARRLLALDPLREPTHRALMRLYDSKGERTLALKQYQTCRDVLAAELGLSPEIETEELAEGIRAGAARTEEAADAVSDRRASRAEPLPLPDKPSIAVLPFTNMSGDPEQEYFTDGITEDIITALSRISGLLVVARHSTTVYKGKAVDVKTVGREQGVRHVLEGSVRKGGNRIRVTAQLIDATTGDHQWAEHYDGKLDDIFKVQDEITKKVTTELNVQLARGEQARVWARGTSNIKAWENVIRAWPLTDDHVKESNVEAQHLAGEAVHLDPTYPTAWVTLGWTHWEDALWGWGESRDSSMKTALSCAQRALECDSENPEAFALLGYIHLTNKNAEKAIELSRKAVALSPNHASNVALAATAMIFGGEPKNGLPLMKRAMRLSPIYPQWYFMMVGVVHHIVGDQDKAIGVFRECVAKEPETTVHRIWLASALIEVARDEEAKLLAAEILEIDPDFTTSGWVDGFGRDEYLANLLLTNLGKAGLPN